MKNLNAVIKKNLNSDKGVKIILSKEKQDYLSYKQIYNISMSKLSYFQKIGLKKGSILILQYQGNELCEFICTFWACVIGGIIPVPLAIGNTKEHRKKLIRVYNILDNKYIISTKNYSNSIKELFNQEGIDISEKLILEEETENYDGNEVFLPEISEEDTAFIQFSSGSTADPKGVVLTHANIISNTEAIIEGSKAVTSDKTLSWMPLTHDMGLIGFHITPFVLGMDQYIMSTNLFIKNPLFWLELASMEKVSLLSSPNFGYNYFLKAYDRKKDSTKFMWDLSSVRLIFNGAEPISVEISNRFLHTLRSYKLKNSVMFPVYGMAEATLAITFPRVEEELKYLMLDKKRLLLGESIQIVEEGGVKFVNCGNAVKFTQVRITYNEMVQEENIIGNIEIRGKGVTNGYINKEIMNNQVYSRDGWLKTGDLGFIRQGEIYVTGRAKDIIFLNGKNYFAHDLESMLEEIKGIRLGNVVVGAVSDEQKIDKIIVFVVFRRDIEDFIPVIYEIKEQIAMNLGIEISYVVPVKKIYKTTSGKIQRYKLIENFLKGEYKEELSKIDLIVKELENTNQNEEVIDNIEMKLLKIYKEVLDNDIISVDKHFILLGGDSIKATKLISRIFEEFGVEVPIKIIFEEFTLLNIASYIREQNNKEQIIIEKSNLTESYPILPSQEKLYLVNEVDNKSTLYNLYKVFKVKGRLDNKKLRDAVQKLVEFNDIFRTRFFIEKNKVVQKVNEVANNCYEYINLESDNIMDIINELNKPFDLNRTPLFRIKLVDTLSEGQFLMISIHHIITDGTSMGIILDKLNKIYSQKEVNNSNDIDFKDYCYWRRQAKADGLFEEQKKYWLNIYKDNPEKVAFPLDYKREKYPTYEGSTYSFNIDKVLKEKIDRVLREKKVTMFMLLYASYNILMEKYSNQNDIVVGVPTASRKYNQLNEVIGMFINTLPLRSIVDNDLSINEYLQKVKKDVLDAFNNDEYFVEELIGELNIEKEINRNPLFDTVFIYQNMDMPDMEIGGAGLEELKCVSKTSKVDLTVEINNLESQIEVMFEYRVDLFKKSTIKRIARHYINIINQVVNSMDVKIRNIQLATKKEEREILNEFNNVLSCKYPATVKDLFEKQVKETPNNIAVVCNNQSITYEELNNRANQLARVLDKNGIGEESIVAIIMGRSIARIVSLLAIIKVGGAYLPIERNNPIARINYMLKDSKSKLLIMDQGNIEKLEYENNILVYDESLYKNQLTCNLDKNIDNYNLAYIIYTSGTSGNPKGVMVEHKNLSVYVDAFLNQFRCTGSDRMLQQASYAFDTYVEELYPMLLTGGTIVVAQEEDVLDARQLAKLIYEERITIISVSPHLLNELNKYLKECDVHTFISGGDVLKKEYITNLIDIGNVYNTYGPTETTVCATYHKCSKLSKTIPIGKPIKNYRVYIMDDYLQLCPIGVVGEICIAGKGVTRGYLNNKEKTDKSFIDCVYKQERLYRTGDLGKWTEDGNIEYIGRKDQQVNLRGYRIELQEIERKILMVKEITDVVVINSGKDANQYLCAYIVAKRKVLVEEIKKHLVQHLPIYMIPTYFVMIDKIPLNNSGKVDKKALPEPKANAYIEKKYVEPKTEEEINLARIWKEILEVTKVGVDDDFFELGGHSLKATMLITKIQNTFNVKVPISEVFNRRTIKLQLNYILMQEQRINDPISKVFGKKYYPLSSAQKRLYLINQLDEESTLYNMPQVLMVEGKLDKVKLEKVLNKLMENQESLRTVFKEIDGAPVQVIKEEIKLHIDFEECREQQVDQKIENFIRPFDLSNGPLLRIMILKTGDSKYKIMFDTHHIISDWVSMDILVKEIMMGYNSDKISNLNIQYKDFSELQNKQKNTDEIDKQRKYWMEILGGDIPELILPTDYERSKVQNFQGNTIEFDVGEKITKDLHEFTNSNGNTLFMVLLAAYNILLFKYSGQEDILIGTPVAGRTRVEYQNIIGMFVNTLVMRNHPKSSKIVKEFLNEVKENALKAYENQEYQFDQLVEELSIKRKVNRNPIFDTMFVLQNADSNELELDGLKISKYNLVNKVSKFDLIITAIEQKDSIKLSVEYSTSLFKAESINKFMERYIIVLENIIKYPDRPISEIDFLSEDEIINILTSDSEAALTVDFNF
ncbi:non-ribosomal peptide synthetase [Oceanirhabdus sp. W0125-5]|uniref:non-ribosomal peptide synthetase n=1 Tax=Oceanirhabdus sp. W0125-5 TaxID=2999116 RepID=UPI0022F2FD57|nr:non-ribosomal peptide synthetase [Oceanirhabdus sp. W0125-5]WBW99494.1 amino acid adenylation domain-containing protein [Oceanirhabdus sp. W0125-5]